MGLLVVEGYKCWKCMWIEKMTVKNYGRKIC